MFQEIDVIDQSAEGAELRDVAIQLSQLLHRSASFFSEFGAFLLLWVVFFHLFLSYLPVSLGTHVYLLSSFSHV